ncbi:hypothetical protein CAter282_0993 [Collimonas arenae]|uniref:Uncharacterized protein n=1 Tax=Collimonas arenae TaxID=279058 RepID=A0A127PMB7_9BURK|nr:hypothetical protein CAter10_1071 [Collimonas arenae]AMP08788.1 hypothetical protein CAter282_0993 [Collimonas arenae]
MVFSIFAGKSKCWNFVSDARFAVGFYRKKIQVISKTCYTQQ